ncbi:dihydroxy-acid dehydratase [Pleomorphovibrio marinus]|uniref:dihydroxy-acid dehydratase n=1 Tax=Pleomorphovibrio marinus TaxID=2164132 RepID=UPI000E0AB965|nr:dihydroxy-acid dehydratase [Pleomorphovibrio marinus]
MSNSKKYSWEVSDNQENPGSMAMLYATGLSDEKMKQPFVGVASCGYESNPCNMHLNDFAKAIKDSTVKSKLTGLVFNTIGISDGISMGTAGMRYSLPSREIIADSIESFILGHSFDGVVVVAGCDKNMPGAVMGMLRVNRPGIMVYGGTIRSGKYKNEKLNLVSAFEAYGKKIKNEINDEDYMGVIKNACPGAGACGGMYTANTMSSAIEAMGLSLPYSSTNPATSPEKRKECDEVGNFISQLLEKNIKPKDIVTKKSLENAVRVAVSLGGSTNAVLHLLAIAKTAGVEFNLEDFKKINAETPLLGDFKPSGKYLMEDLHLQGGLPAFMRYLLDNGMLHGDCLTVTGKTLAENLAEIAPVKPEKGGVIYPLEDPIKESGHLCILSGNLAPEGAVAKISGKEGKSFTGKAKVYDSEQEANDAMKNHKVEKGDVVVIRYIGPKGGPGMPEMLKPTSIIIGTGLGADVALITDGRFSGGTHGFVVGHITPEAFMGGPIGLLKDGDIITINSEDLSISCEVSEEEFEKRRKNWKNKDLSHLSGTLKKYSQLVSTASEGCVTDNG